MTPAVKELQRKVRTTTESVNKVKRRMKEEGRKKGRTDEKAQQWKIWLRRGK